MQSKRREREQAIAFRQQGLSYSEIRQRVPVAKSSLSVWLRQVGLSEWQRQRLRIESGLLGARVRRSVMYCVFNASHALTRMPVKKPGGCSGSKK
jgi:hypothetical protein